MPYRRRTRNYRRKPYGRRPRSGLKSQIKKVVRATLETKHQVAELVSNTVTQTPKEFQPIDLAQGLDSTNRVGDVVFAHNLRINGTILGHSSSAKEDLVRIMVVWSQKALLASDMPTAVNVPSGWDNYVVLYDRTFTIFGIGGMRVKHFSKNIKLFRRLQYKAATAADYTRGRVSCWYFTDSSATQPQFGAWARVTYKDI